MQTDYHNHFLPAMDDGAKDPDMSVAMLEALLGQGIRRVVATPHYYRHREPVAAFLARREAALSELTGRTGELQLLLGAEVALERGLAGDPELGRLCLGDSKILLLELPYGDYRPWMLEEVCNVAWGCGVTPLLAHIERFLPWYGEKSLREFLALEDVVFQVNWDSLTDRKNLKFALSMIKEGLPVVFGTDAHNLDRRPPRADLYEKTLARKLTTSQKNRLEALNRDLV